MNTRKPSLDEARLRPHLRRNVPNTNLPVHYDTDTPPSASWVQAAGGDHLRLRGIPAIGHGVAGVIRGTQPEQAATNTKGWAT